MKQYHTKEKALRLMVWDIHCFLCSSTDVLTEGIFFKGFITAIAISIYTQCTAVWCDLRNEFILWSNMYEIIPPGSWLSLISHLNETKQNSSLCS